MTPQTQEAAKPPRTPAQTEALLQLHRVVKEAPEENFDMRNFICRTSRCAYGWAAVDPWFKENTTVAEDLAKFLAGGYDCFSYSPFSGSMPRVFGLTEKQAIMLFGGNLDPHLFPPSKDSVLEKIQSLVEGEDISDYPEVEEGEEEE